MCAERVHSGSHASVKSFVSALLVGWDSCLNVGRVMVVPCRASNSRPGVLVCLSPSEQCSSVLTHLLFFRNRLMNRLQVTLRIACRLAVILSVMFLLPAVGWSQDSTNEQQKEAEAAEPAKEPLFVVPEGSPGELFAFINKVKRTRPQATKREELIAHLKLQIQAVLDACDQIIKSEPDEATEVRAINEK